MTLLPVGVTLAACAPTELMQTQQPQSQQPQTQPAQAPTPPPAVAPAAGPAVAPSTTASADGAAPTVPPPGGVVRLAGDASMVAEKRGSKTWRAGRFGVYEHLPEGYPAPTPPGTIELKSYPGVRRAEFTGQGADRRGANRGFWPLFRHISDRDIAMTSPVEMDYQGVRPINEGEPIAADAQPPAQPQAQPQTRPTGWTMSFLYRSKDLGPTGSDDRNNVQVVDAPPVTVIAAGVVGSPSQRVIDEGVRMLREYLSTSEDWEVAGDVRGLFYNGPDVAESRKWAEIQVPVRPRRAAQPASEPTTTTAR